MPLFGSVRNVNAPGPDEEGLPPRSVKRRNVRCESDDRSGQPIEFRQLHRGRVQHFASLGTARDSAGGQLPRSFVGSLTVRNMISASA